MGRHIGPVCRLCRREGEKLYLKGYRCTTNKCAIERRNVPPGQHGQTRKKATDYALQLREKQKAKRIYGTREGQFRNLFNDAVTKKGVITGEHLLQLLERRLDNVVYRLGMAASRSEARQLVTHRHFRVNSQRVNVPSYVVKTGDVVTADESSKTIQPIQSAVRSFSGRIPSWLEFDPTELKGVIARMPNREDIDTQVQEQLIVEYYSR
ncbi:MAG TPA: 30S ribosomal protein S4 [Armatimonadota bacterium]|nr:30S ribosomal protein S4 [Armatimonadota bacterium]